MEFEKLLSDWLSKNEWDDVIQTDNDGDLYLNFRVDIENQSYNTYVQTDKERGWIYLFMYSPFNVNSDKVNEVLQLINRIHQSTYYGRLTIIPENNSLQYKHIISLNGMTPNTDLLDSMYSTANELFNTWHSELIELSITSKTYSDLLDDWAKNDADNPSS